MTQLNVFMLLILSMMPLVGFSELSREEATKLFNEADGYFRQAGAVQKTNPDAAEDLYRKAALRFERIVNDGGVLNGGLYYNIGNSYFNMGDYGRAILNYRRAELYLKNDPNLQQNLTVARARQKDAVSAVDSSSKVKTILLFWHYDLSVEVRAGIFASVFILFWALLSVRLYIKKGLPYQILVVCAVIALLFAGSLGWDEYSRHTYKHGVVLNRQVTARKGDGQSYQPSFKKDLHSGLEFRLRIQRNGWYQIELADGRRCWIPDSAAALID